MNKFNLFARKPFEKLLQHRYEFDRAFLGSLKATCPSGISELSQTHVSLGTFRT